jgi:SET domain-containing protein
MKLGNGKYVDAIYSLDVKARYINDCRQRSKYNVYFEKRPQEDRALVIALRDIEEGEELYVDYGKFYWVAYNLLHPDQPVR